MTFDNIFKSTARFGNPVMLGLAGVNEAYTPVGLRHRIACPDWLKTDNPRQWYCLYPIAVILNTGGIFMENQGKTGFTLLAISKLYNTRVNLVGIDENRRWIRPMPIFQSDIFAQNKKLFEVFGVTEIVLNDWWGAAPRAEDRFYVRNPQILPQMIKVLNQAEKEKLLRSLVDNSVDAIFSRGRTLGLIKAAVKDVNFRRNPYQPLEYEARLVFEDTVGNMRYNWMVTDLLWHKNFQDFIRENPGFLSIRLKETREMLNTGESYLVIGLTRVFIEHPGPYGGCWPQVLGIIIL